MFNDLYTKMRISLYQTGDYISNEQRRRYITNARIKTEFNLIGVYVSTTSNPRLRSPPLVGSEKSGLEGPTLKRLS